MPDTLAPAPQAPPPSPCGTPETGHERAHVQPMAERGPGRAAACEGYDNENSHPPAAPQPTVSEEPSGEAQIQEWKCQGSKQDKHQCEVQEDKEAEVNLWMQKRAFRGSSLSNAMA